MSINIYGFKDRVTGIVLLIRAESREQSKRLFEEYIEALNDNVITDFQVIKEIPPGTLRASGFDIEGVVNGGNNIAKFDDGSPKALYINLADNSYAFTPSAAGNTPAGAFTAIMCGRASDWPDTFENSQVMLSKYDLGRQPLNTAYLFEAATIFVSEYKTTLTDDQGVDITSTRTQDNAFNDNETMWFRTTWDGSTTIDLYISLDSSTTPYDEVEWEVVTSNVVTSFILNPGDDNVTVGAREVTDSASADGFNGVIYRAMIIDGVDPTALPSMDMNPADYTGGSSWNTPLTGELWTLNGDAKVSPYTPEES